MKLMAVRRVQIMQTGKSDVPLPPAPPPHPGYAPNAALHAIKRHAQEFISPKENEVGRRNNITKTKFNQGWYPDKRTFSSLSHFVTYISYF